MSMSESTEGPRDLAVQEAITMWLDGRELEYTEETLRDYRSRLSIFAEWCDEQDIETVGEIDGWTIERFRSFRAGQGLAPTTLKGQMAVLSRWFQYLADIGAVDEMLPHKVDIPTPDRGDETSDTMLPASRAKRLLAHYRDQRARFGEPEHALLEVLWYTGARIGAVRALDLDDFDRDAALLEYRHRAEMDTPLKKKESGERAVALPAEVVEALSVYVDEHRPLARDDYGREPLFATNQGRASLTTLQKWCYHATIPCRHSECPHDKSVRTCEWTTRNGSHNCPSSRSPHQVRTGSITWQLNRGLSWADVGERVNSDPDTLRRYYDKESERGKMEKRRRDQLDKLGFDQEDNNDH